MILVSGGGWSGSTSREMAFEIEVNYIRSGRALKVQPKSRIAVESPAELETRDVLLAIKHVLF